MRIALKKSMENKKRETVPHKPPSKLVLFESYLSFHMRKKK